MVGVASGKAFAMTPRAGAIAAPDITVAIEIDKIVGLSILFLMRTTSLHFSDFMLTEIRFSFDFQGNFHTLHFICPWT